MLKRAAFYIYHEHIKKDDFFEYTDFFKKTQYWSFDKILEFQWEKFSELINSAYNNVAYYKEIFDKNSIAWMSRLETKKTQPLYSLILELSAYQQQNSIPEFTLYIIGEGPEKEKLRKFCSDQKIITVFTGRIEKEELENFVLNHIHVSFSMGTSALEFAKLGIPSVLTPGENQLYNDMEAKRKYRFLFNSNDYNLSSEPFLGNEGTLLSFNEVIELVRERWDELNAKSYSYVNMNHNMDLIFLKLLKYFETNKFTYQKLKALDIFSFNFFERMAWFYINSKEMIKKISR
jgi:hypothetical protein